MDYYVYILKCGDGSLYCGYTNNLDARIKTHNSGKGAKYTRSHLPVTLAYYECFSDKNDALKREAAIKKLTRPEKEALVATFCCSTDNKKEN